MGTPILRTCAELRTLLGADVDGWTDDQLWERYLSMRRHAVMVVQIYADQQDPARAAERRRRQAAIDNEALSHRRAREQRRLARLATKTVA